VYFIFSFSTNNNQTTGDDFEWMNELKMTSASTTLSFSLVYFHFFLLSLNFPCCCPRWWILMHGCWCGWWPDLTFIVLSEAAVKTLCSFHLLFPCWYTCLLCVFSTSLQNLEDHLEFFILTTWWMGWGELWLENGNGCEARGRGPTTHQSAVD